MLDQQVGGQRLIRHLVGPVRAGVQPGEALGPGRDRFFREAPGRAGVGDRRAERGDEVEHRHGRRVSSIARFRKLTSGKKVFHSIKYLWVESFIR